MKLYTLKDFLKLPAGVIYQKTNSNIIEIKGEWVSDNLRDWTCTQFGDVGNTANIWLELSYGASYPIRTEYYGRDGCFDDDDVEFLVFESWDLEQMKKQIELAMQLLPPQKVEG